MNKIIVYNNKILSKEKRTPEYNGFGVFEQCEKCGYIFKHQKGIHIRYYDRTKKIMCDRCIDKSSNIEFWDDEYAERNGLPPYPYY